MQSTLHACRLFAARLFQGLAARGSFAFAVLGLAVLSAGLVVPAQAQDATGVVTGRVQNAVNGSALNLARVTVAGTAREVFTNEYGEYRVAGLPAGEVTLNFSYTGLETQSIKVNVVAGQEVAQDVSLASARVTQALRDDQPITLDAFTVTSERETNAANIAANEQRYSANLKNVVSSDAFGDVTEGNVGEFMKFLPGVSVDYVAADVRTMSVRGFADNFTSISMNGARVASASSGASSRSFEFEQVSINNIARVEVSKAPTPSMPADSLGGAVNMISKNAFERKGTEFKYRAYLSLNSEDLDVFKKTPGPMDEKTFKALPGFDFDLTIPFTKNFGVVITGLSSNQFNEQHRTQTVYNHAQAGATPANPYLQQYVFQDGPKNTFRDSLSVKADWKVAPGHVISANWQSNYYLSQFGNRNYNFNVGTSATSTPSGGQALTYSPTSVVGAGGRGTLTGEMSFRDKYGLTNAAILSYRFNGSKWDADANVNWSKSKTWYRDGGRGHFSSVRTSLIGVNRLAYEGITVDRPSTIRAYNSAGTELDWTNLANFNITQGRVNPIDAYDQIYGFDASAKRDLDTAFQSAIRAGISIRRQERDIKRWDQTWTYNGLNGSTNALAFMDTDYVNQDPHFGLPRVNYVDPYLLWSTWQNNPNMFTQTANQQRDAERFRRNNSQFVEEVVSAAYVQAEGKFLNNRLTVVTGVRFEKTEDEGRGPLVRGNIGSTATLAQIQANIVERGLRVDRSYDDYYPSFHATYEITPDLLARFAYAKTLGRPDMISILPSIRVNTSLTDSLNDGGQGGDVPPATVIWTNGELKPWTSDGVDFALEYYAPSGGIVTAGMFRKEIKDFWGTNRGTVTQAFIDQFGLEQEALGLTLQTPTNVGDATISGVEFSVSYPLAFIPAVGKNLTAFANGTKLKLEGANEADFDKFIEETASWGVTFSRKPVVVSLKQNYRGRQRLSEQVGTQYNAVLVGVPQEPAGGFYREYYAPRIYTDINLEYQFSKRVTAFANARNIFNVRQRLQRYNDLTPEHARTYRIEEFGVQFAVGVKGTW
jgi:iron complex outermembrane receptor protein